MSTLLEHSISYSIEVSGWDMSEDFFVETTSLGRALGAGQSVTVHHPVRRGAVVFLRLVHPTALGPAFPVAYHVEDVCKANGAPGWELRLAELRARPHRRREDPQWGEEILAREGG